VPPIGALGERVVETGAGFVFDDWTDETKMLAQIERLVGPGSATEWEAARTRARAVCGMGVDDMCSRTLATYRAAIVGAGRRESAGKTLTAENLADAGRTTAIERWWKSRPGLALASPSPATIAGGQNVPVASPGASAPVPGAFLRFARRVRSTAVGGLLVKVIPSGLRERLRASLQ